MKRPVPFNIHITNTQLV